MPIYRLRVLLVLLALTIGTSALQGSTTQLVPTVTTSSTITCNVGATTTANTVSVSVVLGSTGTNAPTVTVTQSPANALTMTGGTSAVSSTTTPTIWTFTQPAGCTAAAGSVTITFTPSGNSSGSTPTTSTSNTVTLTVATPTNTFLSMSAVTSPTSRLVVNCNLAAGGATPASVNISPATAIASSLSSTKKLNVAVGSISVTGDTTTAYSAGTLSNSPITVSVPNPASFYSGSSAVSIGVSGSVCGGLSQNSNITTADITFTSQITGGGLFNDSIKLYVKVVQLAPVTVSGAITLYCQAGGSVISATNNLTVSTASTSTVSINVTSPGWIGLAGNPGGPATGTTVSGTPKVISVTAATCDGLTTAGQAAQGSISVGPPTGTAPWPIVPVTVFLQVVSTTPLIAVPSTLQLTYRKGGPAATGTIAVSSKNAAGSYFSVVGVTGLGAYFTADTSSATAPKSPATRVITFSTTSLNDSLSPGTTTYTVNLHVAGSQDLPISIVVTVNGAAPVLSTVEGTTRSITWDPSTGVPVPVVTLVSSDSPIAYTIAGVSGIVAGPTTGGLAFSYGTPINVVFSQAAFQSASPGQTLNGTLTVSGGGVTIPIVFNVLVSTASTQANLVQISPTNLPTGTPNQVFTISLYGSGFISSTAANTTTVVGLASSAGGGGVTPANYTPNYKGTTLKILNSSTMVLTITVPAGGSDIGSGGLLNFNAPGFVYIAACNPNGATCTPNSAVQLSIGSGPTITSITSSSSFSPGSASGFAKTQAGSPAVAPYDMISVFGSNFCNSGGTGCGSSILMGNANSGVYSSTLSPDGTRNVTVNVYSHPAPSDLSTAILAQAPLLFVTNTQINALFPGDTTNNSALATALATGWVDISVGFGSGYSPAVPVATALTDPGIFTIGSDGVGDAAALATTGNYPVIGSANPAVIRPTGAPSDMVQIYMTGLGAPDTGCMTVSTYDTAAGLQTIDGAVLQASYLGALKAPCFLAPATSAAFTFGYSGSTLAGIYASDGSQWAGWVTIPGLYGANVTLPANAAGMKDASNTVSSPFTAPTQVKVIVASTTPAKSSQDNVTLWVAPQLTMASLSSCASTAVDISYTCALPAITGGAAYTYTATGSPAAFNALDQTNGFTATGAPAVGSYLVTLTATETTHHSMSATGSFNIYQTGALQTLQAIGTTPTPSVYGTPNNAVTTVQAVGVSTYTYSLASGAWTAWAAVDPTTGVVSITGSAPVGSNQIVVAVSDNNDSSQVGTLTFYAPVAPLITSSNGASLSANGASTSAVTLTTLGMLGATATNYTLEQGPTGVAVAGSIGQNVTFTGGNSLAAGAYSITVKGTDGSHVSFINLSLHLN